MFKRLLTVAIVIPVIVFAQYERPGSTSAQFLKIGISARAAAMGQAYISVAEGAEATVYNPSALARLKGTDISFTHTQWFAGINHEFAAIARNFNRIGTFGFSITALYTDEMKVTTPLQPGGTGETFYASNYRFGLSYSRFLTDHVSIGFTGNYIHLSLYSDFQDNAYSFDIAASYITNVRGFSFAMEIANFGSDVKFVDEAYPLPVNFNFGLSMNALELDKQKVLVSISGIKPNDGQPLLQAGAEWNYTDFVFIRGGYRFNHDIETFSLGGGFRIKVFNYKMRFDYSYSDFDQLGAPQRFSIGLHF